MIRIVARRTEVEVALGANAKVRVVDRQARHCLRRQHQLRFAMGEFAAAASRASTCLPELAQGALQQKSPRVPVLGGRGVASRAVAQPRQRCKQLLLPQAFPFALCLRRHQLRDERRWQLRTALGHGAADAVDGSRVDGCLNHRAEALPAYSVLTAGRHARDARHARDLIHADRARVHLECKGTLLLLEGVLEDRHERLVR
mmetsp:Transcript_9390/g.31131  ORF Transcript_9390/g.31131 Transcript_9390/m.31131 type:complete len:201 (-) Transcript_9390:640-1242(-)